MNLNGTQPSDFSLQGNYAMSSAYATLMRKVYLWMALALMLTGFTAYGVASSPAILMAIYTNSILLWGLVIAEFALVIGVSAAINRISLTTATLMFALYSVINGALLSSIFVIYTATSIASVFFVTAGTFAVMAVYGYVTKRDLTKLGNLLFMALLGIIIASVVNMFVKSSGFDLIISYVGVLIFVGLTAYDSQKIKEMMFAAPDASESSQKLAVLGALDLYLDFINLFIYLLRIFGNRNND